MNRLWTTGQITTRDLAPTGNAPTPGSFVQLPPAEVAGSGSAFDAFLPEVTAVGVSVTGIYTGQLNANGTVDGVNWEPLGGYPFVNEATGVQSEFIPSGAIGEWTVNVVGLQAIRIDAPNAVTGTATVSMNASDSPAGPRAAVNPVGTGAQNASVPANSADVVVSAQPGQLVRVVVLTSGSAATLIYDNASAGSGALIGEIPATPVVGAIYLFNEPTSNGITVKGASTNSGLDISFD